MFRYDDPSALSAFWLMRQAADCQNKYREHFFGDESCTYRDDLEADLLKLIAKTSPTALPDSLAFFMAFASFFTEENHERYDIGGGFDPLAFSPKRGKADFIRGFTGYLKDGINYGAYPERLKNLSFLSIEIFADVFFNTTTYAYQCIDTDWKPVKDGVNKKPQKNPNPKEPTKRASK
jgi:hypothetical protein